MTSPVNVADPPEPSSLALYASAIAGVSVDVAWHDEAHALSYCDGAIVHLARARAPHAVLELTLQALLLRQGSLAAEPMHALIGRPARARAYLGLELARGLQARRALLPRAVLAHSELGALPAASRSVDDALQRARASERSTTPAAWGCVLPARVLARTRAGSRARAQADPRLLENVLAERRKAERELEESSILNAFRNPVQRSVGFLGRLLDEIFERQSSGTAAAGGGGADAGEARDSEAREDAQRVVSGRFRPVRVDAMAPAQAFRYPEWDEQRQRYRPHFVHAAEVDPDPEHQRSQQLPTPVASRALRRTLAGLCHGYQPRAHQLQGDDVEVDALVRLRVDALSGHAADARIYRATQRTRRDLGVLVLLDISASTAEHAADGIQVFERQLSAALGLVQALHGWGDRVALYGFHSWGPKLVRIQRLLSFGERPAGRLYERARRITPAGYSRLGAAIRHGSRVLQLRAGTPHHLLVVISDALAYDKGYEGRYAQADTRRALAEARAANTACVCLTLGASTDREVLQRAFGESCHLALPKLHGAERELRSLFERAVGEVSRRRP